LGLVEAVNFVDEHDRPSARRAAPHFGRCHDVFDLLNAGEHGAELDERGFGCVRDNTRERGFTGAG